MTERAAKYRVEVAGDTTGRVIGDRDGRGSIDERAVTRAVYSRCMSMTRTQIYLPEDLRRRVDQLADVEGKSMAEVVREALEHHLAQPRDDVQDVLEETFASVVDAWAPPREEWDRV